MALIGWQLNKQGSIKGNEALKCITNEGYIIKMQESVGFRQNKI